MVAMLAVVLLSASPAVAETVEVEIAGVEAEATSVFLGDDAAEAEVGEAFEVEATSEFLFF